MNFFFLLLISFPLFSQDIAFKDLSNFVGQEIELRGFITKSKQGYLMAELPLKSCCVNVKTVPQVALQGDFHNVSLYRPHHVKGYLYEDGDTFFLRDVEVKD